MRFKQLLLCVIDEIEACDLSHLKMSIKMDRKNNRRLMSIGFNPKVMQPGNGEIHTIEGKA